MTSNQAIELLQSEAERFSMAFSNEVIGGFRIYLDALAAYNEKVNLVADADPVVVVKRHVLDCLAVVEVIESLPDHSESAPSGVRRRKLADIGSGAGLPGLVIAIACPSLDVVLIESVGKKTKFLNEVVDALSLSERVSVVTGRAEELARTPERASFHFVTGRAVGHLGLMAELALPLLINRGRLLCQKSRSQVDKEISELSAFLKPLGGITPEVIVPRFQVAEAEHVIVSIEKRTGTQSKFPRPWADIIRQWK